MRFKRVILIFTLMPAIALADDVIKLNMSDVFFQWRPLSNGSMMCGFAIEGNYLSRENPKTEWDINIDEIVMAGTRVAGISAGSFTVTGKTRLPRAPITEVIFMMDNDAQPLAAQIVGAPNKDNGIRAVLDLSRATKLFAALSSEGHISATLKYSDGATDHLQFLGIRDRRNTGGGLNNPFDQCLRGHTPTLRDPGWEFKRRKAN